MSATFWLGIACVVLGLVCCLLVVIVLITSRRKLYLWTRVLIVAWSLAILLGGICVAGGAFLDRNLPSHEEIMKPIPPRTSPPSP